MGPYMVRWVKVDADLPDHPKIEGLSSDAFRLYVTGLCYCGRLMTDGAIPVRSIRRWGVSRHAQAASELVEAGLWEPADDGWKVHDYLDYQRSRAESEDVSEKRREAGRKGGKAKANSQATTKQDAGKLPGSGQNGALAEKKRGREEKINRVSADADPTLRSLCDHLADRIESNGSPRPAVTERWLTAARLMVERDDRTPEQIHRAIDWCQDDEFWRANVLSMPKLREKYDQLRLQAKRDPAKSRAEREAEEYRERRARAEAQDAAEALALEAAS